MYYDLISVAQIPKNKQIRYSSDIIIFFLNRSDIDNRYRYYSDNQAINEAAVFFLFVGCLFFKFNL